MQNLDSIIEREPDSLRSAVARIIREDSDDDPARYLADLSQHGYISGMVGPLIYYTDTHAFFDRHYDEIERLREEIEDTLGEPLTLSGDLKNALAWFAFEQTALAIADEIGVEL